jgi:hypothetical protein
MTFNHAVQLLYEETTPPLGVELRSICDYNGWLALCGRLHNLRPAADYLRIYRRNGVVEKTTNKDRNKPWEPHAKWAWDTLNQTASATTSIGFYSQSFKTGLTFWGAIDFDLHGVTENHELAQAVMYRDALAAFQRVANQFPEAIVIFEDSGRGFHVLLIVENQIPVSIMHRHMTDACCGKPSAEIIPSPRMSKYGKPLRAPGTWNPEVERVSMILGVAGPESLMPRCRFWLADHKALLPERGFFLSLFFRATKGDQPEKTISTKHSPERPPPREPDQIWKDFGDQYHIEGPNSRHNSLLKLVGECFYQYGTEVVLRFAELQYESKVVTTTASKEEHLAEARIAHSGMVTQWLKKQTTPAEALFHNGLRTVVRQDAFRILHNFAKMAENQSNEEFFVSQKQLAERLNITKPGAALILAEFIKGEAIQLTNKETANRARRYVWLLG